MIIGVSVITCSLIYSIMVAILYFTKKRINNVENKIYKLMVCMNIFGLFNELACCYFTFYEHASAFNEVMCSLFNRLFVLYMLSWLFVFTCYVFFVTFKDKSLDKHGKKKANTIFGIIYVVLFALSFILPLYYFSDGKYVYSYGPAANLLVVFGGITILFDIWCVFRNRKNIKNRQYYPLYVLIILMIIVLIIRNVNPGIILINSTFAFITVLMYFTIENPDVQIMEELYKNKKLVEKSNQDTSNFLFRMTQDIKKPVKDIIEVSERLQNSKNMEEIKEGIKCINNSSINLDYLINDALDVSSMTTKKLKIFDSRYNPVNIFKEIEYRFEKQIDNNVKFNFTISNVIPSYLYGDSIKLKQAVNSVLMNALKHTHTGEINLDVSGIIKYGVCRLIITVSDTGDGISIEEVNNILSLNSEEFANIDLRNRDGDILNLKEVKKLISLLGGNFMVKSEEKGGTTISMILEQKIVESKETEISKKLESYEQSLYRNKRVMVVDDDAKELAQITTFLENHDADVSGSLFGRDAIEKIASNIKYDLILLDDETSTYSALEVLKELKKNKKFNIPVVVMINDNKEFIRLHYLQDGFADCVMKSKLESEINRIMKRF